MSFRASSPQELADLERKAYEFMRKNLRGISKEKAEKRISLVRMQHGSAKMFATVYSLPRIEASERGMMRAIREYKEPPKKKRKLPTSMGELMQQMRKKSKKRKGKKQKRKKTVCFTPETVRYSPYYRETQKRKKQKKKKVQVKSFSDSVWKVRK